MSMTNSPNCIEVVTSVQRRRRWTASEKVRMVEETFAPDQPHLPRPAARSEPQYDVCVRSAATSLAEIFDPSAPKRAVT